MTTQFIKENIIFYLNKFHIIKCLKQFHSHSNTNKCQLKNYLNLNFLQKPVKTFH